MDLVGIISEGSVEICILVLLVSCIGVVKGSHGLDLTRIGHVLWMLFGLLMISCRLHSPWILKEIIKDSDSLPCFFSYALIGFEDAGPERDLGRVLRDKNLSPSLKMSSFKDRKWIRYVLVDDYTEGSIH
jgi:hypothetical protein